MSKVRFSESAIRASYLVENPDFYEYEITRHTEKASDAGDSQNHFVTFEGRSGEMEHVPVNVLFNDKADWAYLPLFVAASGKAEISPEDEFDWDDLVGVKLKAMTKRGVRFGSDTPCNVLSDYRPL